MSMEPQKTEIGGHTYAVSPLPATKAVKLQVRLAKLLRGGLAGLLKSGGVAEGGDDLAAIADGLADTLAHADDDQLERELKLLLHAVECDGKALPWAAMDAHFLGRTMDLWRLAAFALKVNFADFFDGLRGLVGQGSAGLQARFRQTAQSPGSSRAS